MRAWIGMVVASTWMASACSGKDDAAKQPAKSPPGETAKKPADPPPPAESMTAQSCLAATAALLGLPADATVQQDVEVAKDDEARVVQTVAAEALTLRGHPGAICVASATRDRYPCSEEDPDCTDEESLESETSYVVAVMTGGKVTDKRTFTREYAQLVTEGALAWKVVALGKTHDGLLLESSNDSGDSSTTETTWITVADGKLVEHMSYKTGYDDGEFAGEVEHEVLGAESAGYASIKLRVVREDGEDPVEDTCTWNPDIAGYKCDKDLVDDM